MKCFSRSVIYLSVLCVLVGCGGDKGAQPENQEEDGRGFTCEYQYKGTLGNNGCRLAGSGEQEKVYKYDLYFDWWTDSPADVDSVSFRIPYRYCEWLREGEYSWNYEYTCLKDTIGYWRSIAPVQDKNHWRVIGWFGELEYSDALEFYYSIEFLTRTELGEGNWPAAALVHWGDGTDSTYSTYPTRR